jgi:methylthioribose-1-phosphate isomerase
VVFPRFRSNSIATRAFVRRPLHPLMEVATAIRNPTVRGAPLIGITAAFGLALGLVADAPDGLDSIVQVLLATRPTARHLKWTVEAAAATVRAEIGKLG